MIPRGATPAALASNVDLAPTLLALGGASIPASVDGRSLVSALRGDTTAVRDALLIEYYSDTGFPRLKNTGYDAVRTDRSKYIRYRELSGMDELYDLQEAPFELRNLLPDRAPAGVREELSATIDRMASRGRSR